CAALVAGWRAERTEIPFRTVVGEALDGDGVAAREHGAGRPLEEHRRVAGFEDGRVPTLRQIDDQRVGPSFLAVVPDELRAEAPRLRAHAWSGPRIEALLLPEAGHAGDVRLALALTAADGLGDDEREEALEAVGLLKGFAAQNPRELLVLRLVRHPAWFAGRRRVWSQWREALRHMSPSSTLRGDRRR